MRAKLNIIVYSKDFQMLDRLYDQPVTLNKGRKNGPWYKVRYMGRDYRLETTDKGSDNCTHYLRLGTSLPSKNYAPDH